MVDVSRPKIAGSWCESKMCFHDYKHPSHNLHRHLVVHECKGLKKCNFRKLYWSCLTRTLAATSCQGTLQMLTGLALLQCKGAKLFIAHLTPIILQGIRKNHKKRIDCWIFDYFPMLFKLSKIETFTENT